VHKATKKEIDFDLNHIKETFMEAKKNFTDASTLRSHEKLLKIGMAQEVDPLVLTTFLKTCMNLLRDKKVVEGLKYVGLRGLDPSLELFSQTNPCTTGPFGSNLQSTD